MKRKMYNLRTRQSKEMQELRQDFSTEICLCVF